MPNSPDPPAGHCPSDIAANRVADLEAMTETVLTALLSVANEHQLEPIRLNVTMADAAWAAVEGAYERLDLGHDRRSGPERLGGTVAGKSLVNARRSSEVERFRR